MTEIPLSDKAAKKIEAVLGTKDPALLGAFLERLADHENVMRSVLQDAPTAEDLELIRDGIADLEAGRVQSLAEFDAEFRQRNSFASRDNA